MKYIVKVLFLIVLSVGVGVADEFKSVTTLKLKKDEYKTYMVRYDRFEKPFYFRWTLYVNGGLVVQRSYDRFPAQNILKLGYRNNSFKLYLKPKDSKLKVPYIMVKFVEFDSTNELAIFKLFISDEKEEVQIEELKAKKRD